MLVADTGVPRPIAYDNILEAVHGDAAPVAPGRQRRRAAPGELEEERMPAPFLRSEHVRAQFTAIALIRGYDLPLGERRLTDQVVNVRHAAMSCALARRQVAAWSASALSSAR
jgi:hypothetical protein